MSVGFISFLLRKLPFASALFFQPSKTAQFAKVFFSQKQLYTQGSEMKDNFSTPYKTLCTEYYELDKPTPPQDALSCYASYADKAKGPILEPMCGTGRFLVPLAKMGYQVTGFDYSDQMLDVARAKCKKEGISTPLQKATFENFSSNHRYQLVFIPSGSFSLLTKPTEVTRALNVVLAQLEKGGKFVFEVDTVKSVAQPCEVWKGSWIDKPDGSQLVLNTFSRFDLASRINTILCRYELWQKNKIADTEVETFQVRLYGVNEVEKMLKNHGGFKITNLFVPYTGEKPSEETETIVCECEKI